MQPLTVQFYSSYCYSLSSPPPLFTPQYKSCRPSLYSSVHPTATLSVHSHHHSLPSTNHAAPQCTVLFIQLLLSRFTPTTIHSPVQIMPLLTVEFCSSSSYSHISPHHHSLPSTNHAAPHCRVLFILLLLSHFTPPPFTPQYKSCRPSLYSSVHPPATLTFHPTTIHSPLQIIPSLTVQFCSSSCYTLSLSLSFFTPNTSPSPFSSTTSPCLVVGTQTQKSNTVLCTRNCLFTTPSCCAQSLSFV
jgi:hypothetical protein